MGLADRMRLWPGTLFSLGATYDGARRRPNGAVDAGADDRRAGRRRDAPAQTGGRAEAHGPPARERLGACAAAAAALDDEHQAHDRGPGVQAVGARGPGQVDVRVEEQAARRVVAARRRGPSSAAGGTTTVAAASVPALPAASCATTATLCAPGAASCASGTVKVAGAAAASGSCARHGRVLEGVAVLGIQVLAGGVPTTSSVI